MSTPEHRQSVVPLTDKAVSEEAGGLGSAGDLPTRSWVYTANECGCVRIAWAQGEHSKDFAAEISREAAEGYEFHVVPVETLRAMPMECEPHRLARAERATLIEMGL